MRTDPMTGEVLDVGPDSKPCPISEAKRAALDAVRRDSQRGRLLRLQSSAHVQECEPAQLAEDVPPSTDLDFDH